MKKLRRIVGSIDRSDHDNTSIRSVVISGPMAPRPFYSTLSFRLVEQSG